ncbi:phage minor tail protein G [Vibrio furnissii]|uniref:phage minor tail protein G n=1 Tax=Vibrio furnissii TaxID=29494 RepID=UPI001EEB2274|nr:hypothetical protein [Vibrio furnissii]
MMKTFLKKKDVPVGDQSVTLTQLSGLERYDFIEYVATLSKPKMPVQPPEDAPISEKDAFLNNIEKVLNEFKKLTFIAQSRLVAYGCKEFGNDIDCRHQFVMDNFMPDQVKLLHDEVAVFSGIPLNQEPEDGAAGESTDASKESVDPKA